LIQLNLHKYLLNPRVFKLGVPISSSVIEAL